MKQNTDLPSHQIIHGSSEGPRVLLVAGVHGDEYEPMAAALQIIPLLQGNVLKGSVTVIPLANPGAYHAGSRFGDDGLDMARVCPGNPVGTSTERAASEVSRLIRESDYLVDMHTGGITYDIHPLAGYMLHSDTRILEIQRQMAQCFNLPIVWGTEPSPDGRTLSVARDAGIPAIYLEYGGGTGFRPQVTKAYVSGFLNLLRHLGMMEGEYSIRNDGYWVEDPRKDSGFLQGKMPAPTDGIFIGAVQTGSLLKAGDLWGTIIDPIRGSKTEVRADIDGLAFLKRNTVKVNKGDALGGILPITQPGKVVIQE